ncbi:hypothetical protein NIIDMKKI_34580 [Mycobacterium kansasii]|uniref:Uncharacterized protein n=1 Tax=Mycobacterium kansasii TaxID=1768 RepID=A0A7G1IED6_MYCKA|nr:hypothetical protein NIIDMKKI_34580 [Mycobacterium kansasii]
MRRQIHVTHSARAQYPQDRVSGEHLADLKRHGQIVGAATRPNRTFWAIAVAGHGCRSPDPGLATLRFRRFALRRAGRVLSLIAGARECFVEIYID